MPHSKHKHKHHQKKLKECSCSKDDQKFKVKADPQKAHKKLTKLRGHLLGVQTLLMGQNKKYLDRPGQNLQRVTKYFKAAQKMYHDLRSLIFDDPQLRELLMLRKLLQIGLGVFRSITQPQPDLPMFVSYLTMFKTYYHKYGQYLKNSKFKYELKAVSLLHLLQKGHYLTFQVTLEEFLFPPEVPEGQEMTSDVPCPPEKKHSLILDSEGESEEEDEEDQEFEGEGFDEAEEELEAELLQKEGLPKVTSIRPWQYYIRNLIQNTKAQIADTVQAANQFLKPDEMVWPFMKDSYNVRDCTRNKLIERLGLEEDGPQVLPCLKTLEQAFYYAQELEGLI